MSEKDIIALVKAYKSQNKHLSHNIVINNCPWTNEAINMCLNDIRDYGVKGWLDQEPEDIVLKFKQVSQKLSKELIHNLDSVQINQLLFSVSIGNDVYVECDHLSEVKQTLSESTLLFDILMKYLSIYKSIKNVLAKKHSKLLSHKTIIQTCQRNQLNSSY